ncbi:MAG: DUF3306 domain-containing protein [Acetobacteraceae bacterium]|nr:DUF3306 domain-containing protein [Acetobacteraceae bacterium]
MSEGFFSRWSRRKQAAEKGAELPEDATRPAEPPAAEAPRPAPVAEQPPEPVAAAPEAAAEEEAFDISSLPPVESLTAESDFSAFLKPGVPGWLKTAALRKAWVLDAAIRDYRSPLDYGWDFNTPGGLPAGFSADLGVVGEQLKKLIAQAVGAPPEPAEEATPAEAAPEPRETPDPEPPAMVPPVAVAEEARPPEDPETGLQMHAMSYVPAPEPVPEPRRRHGGALPS